MGVALVQEQRLAAVHGQLQLALESAALRVAWCEVAEVVQPAFANGHDFRLCEQLAKLGDGFVGHLQRVVRMRAVRGEQPAGMRSRKVQRLLRAFARGAGDHHLADAGRGRARQHGVQIVLLCAYRRARPRR